MKCSAEYRYGMSGTVVTGDPVADMRLAAVTGEIIHEISNAEMIEAGDSAAPIIKMLVCISREFETDYKSVAKSRFFEADLNGAVILDSLIKRGVLAEDFLGEMYLKRKENQLIIRPVEMCGSNFDEIWSILQKLHYAKIYQRLIVDE